MRDAEEAAFARGVEVEALMDKAGAGVARAVTRFFRIRASALFSPERGHNAGDASRRRGMFAATSDGRSKSGFAFQESDCSELMRKKLDALRRAPAKIPDTTAQGNSDIGVTLVETLGRGRGFLECRAGCDCGGSVPGHSFTNRDSRWLAWIGRKAAAA